MAGIRRTWLKALKLFAGLGVTFSLCFVGLFLATLVGIYETSHPDWQFLNSEHRIRTAAQLLMQLAIWSGLYRFARKKLKATPCRVDHASFGLPS